MRKVERHRLRRPSPVGAPQQPSWRSITTPEHPPEHLERINANTALATRLVDGILTGLTGDPGLRQPGPPGLAGIVAELQILVGAFSVYPWLAGIGLLGVVLLAAAFLRNG